MRLGLGDWSSVALFSLDQSPWFHAKRYENTRSRIAFLLQGPLGSENCLDNHRVHGKTEGTVVLCSLNY
jgi:hypothetical protein